MDVRHEAGRQAGTRKTGRQAVRLRLRSDEVFASSPRGVLLRVAITVEAY